MMAKKADKDRVRADLAPPDYEGAIEIIRNRIQAKKNQVSGINGEVSGLWDQIEKKGVNKEGARVFLKLDGLEEPVRNDVLRTIQAMSAAAGWDKAGDLVDKITDNVVQMPAPAAKPAAATKPTAPKKDGLADKAAATKPAAGDADLNPAEKLDRADYIQAMADHITQGSVLEFTEAHALAVEIWDDLPNRDRDAPRTRENAVANAEKEMESWPAEGDDKPPAKA